MRVRSRLKHTAAGLLYSLTHRNNDVDGFWAPGLLYRDAGHSPHSMLVDLLNGSSQPPSDAARLMAACYAVSVRTALGKLGIPWNQITRASVSFQFNAEVSNPWFYFPCAGDPFICTVVLATGQHEVTLSVNGRCQRHDAHKFNRRASPS